MLWVDVLNGALEWGDPVAVSRWMSRGGAVVLEQSVHARLVREAALLRRTFAASYLGVDLQPEDHAAVSQWLAAVSLQAGPASLRGVETRGLVGRRARGLPDPFEPLLSTALVELLTVGTMNEQPTAVHRCHGLRRGTAAQDGCPSEWHQRFAAIAGVADLIRNGSLHQCPRLIVTQRGGRFCSKSCSNASFAGRKASDDPSYFAAKQERYRRRLQRRSRRPDPGAFVFVD
jgi:hypothetical protein